MKKTWFAVLRDEYDNDLGYGSYDFETAKAMCEMMRDESTPYIMEVEEEDGKDPIGVAQYLPELDYERLEIIW